MENDVISVINLMARAIECEKALSAEERSVLNTIMKTMSPARPFILLAHLLKDLAAAIMGTRQTKIISRGIISTNIKQMPLHAIVKTSLERGSSWWMIEVCRVY
jgi:hypothetical protein